MSSFEVPVIKITRVEHHPDADRLSLVFFRGFTTISAKLEDGSHRYAEGNLAVYVPEGAVVPEWLLRQGFWDETKSKGMLAGSKGDRVKAMRLRGIVSQGIMFPVFSDPHLEDPLEDNWIRTENGDTLSVSEGDDVAAFLGITKYEPPIPIAMAGEVFNLGRENTLNFDVENLQKFPHVMNDPDEMVAVTEKLHGTFCQIAYISEITHEDGFCGGSVFVGSKGLSSQGLMLKNNEANVSNLYVRAVITSGIAADFAASCNALPEYDGEKVFLCGEVYGVGVQDLGYGQMKPSFRAFAAFRGNPRDGSGRWLDYAQFEELVVHAGIKTVPLLALSRWADVESILPSLRDGKTTLGGGHIREGVVIAPVVERRHDEMGRVILKAVSPDYLLRKGNVTEFA